MDKNTGGSAFPEPGLSGLPNGDYIQGQSGMTLRDYFAAHAPEPPINWRGGDRNKNKNDIIEWRWSYADAMLEARES